MRAILLVTVIGLVGASCPALAQEPAPAGDQPATDPLGRLRQALEETGGPGLAVTPREGAVLFAGQAADGRATLVHEVGDARPVTLTLEVALEADADAGGEAAGGAETPPRGVGLVFMTGPDEYVAFVLMPGGRTGVFAYDPVDGLQQRMLTGWEFDSTQPHTLTLTFDGRRLTFGLDGKMGGATSNGRIARATGPVGLIVLGDVKGVVRKYDVREG